jgi:hypothetical protein
MKFKMKFNKHIKTKPADITLILHNNVLLYAEKSGLINKPLIFHEYRMRKSFKNVDAQTFAEVLSLHGKQQTNIFKSYESGDSTDSTVLAEAARRLLPKISSKKRIALALPNSEFIATSLQLPTRATDNIKTTVNLQKEILLPGLKEQLLLTVQAPLKGKNICALWMHTKRAEALWKAFEKQNLYLSCIFPRSIIVLQGKKTPFGLYDEDENSITYLNASGGVIQQWLYITKDDYELPEFREQLNETLLNKHLKSERKDSVNDWKVVPSKAAYNYAFVPPSAIARLAKSHQFKNRFYGIGLVIVLITSIIGGVFYAISYEKALRQELADLKRSTYKISEFRVEVGQIEETIAAIKEFPKQEIVKVLNILDKRIPKDTWINRFYIEEGVIKLEGYSINPTRLIEILSQQNEFYDIEQSRGTVSEFNNEKLRFGISVKLKNFNQNYWLTYFSKER